MSIRSTVTNGTWQNIGSGPATVQVISPDATGVAVMIVAAASAPSPAGTPDGLVLNAANPTVHISLVEPIWAQVAQTGLTALVAVQPEAS